MNVTIITAIITGATTSGVCSIILYLIQRHDKKADKTSALNKLVLGIGYDRLVENCTRILKRGWYSIDEYHDLKKYLYDPYVEAGGNGTAERLWKEMEHLPVKEAEE